MLVEGDADALSTAADGNTRVTFACLDGFSQGVCIVWIVAALFAVSAKVLVGPSFCFEPLFDVLLQGEACMVGAESNDFHAG